MTITFEQFREMLALHGADFSRWDGVDSRSLQAFLEDSPDAKALYDEALALDRMLGRFTVPALRADLIDDVMRGIDERPVKDRNVVDFGSHRKKVRGLDAVPRPLFWGGALAACAASVLVIFVGTGSPLLTSVPAGDPMVAASAAGAGQDVDILMAELHRMAEEEVAAQEIIGLWEVAALSSNSADGASSAVYIPDDGVENFLGQVFPVPAGNF